MNLTRPTRRQVLLGGTASLALLLIGCSADGDDDAAAATPSDTSARPSAAADGIFDPSTVHDVSVTVDTDQVQAMLGTYESTGEKSWIEATVTIDGTTYEQVGLRLKGNSSLRNASGSAPGDLPWLIRLDKFVDGRDHEGYEDLVVRSNTTETSLNEAVALTLLAEAGLPSQASAPVRFRVNDGDPALRLVVEHPDDDAWYESAFDGPGALYKSESTGDWSYRGDDQAAYTDVFDQEGGKDVADLGPLIELLQFLDEADDTTFAAELDDRLDVDRFTTYLAMMDLVENVDDIDGPGNNSYLWWDAATERFTIVPWDLNLAFGAMGGMGGPGRGAGGMGPMTDDGRRPTPPTGTETMPAPPTDAGGEAPTGGEPPTIGDRPAGGPGGAGGGPRGFGRTNPLVERFHATTSLAAAFEARLEELQVELFDSGRAQAVLDERAAVLVDQASDLVEADTVADDADAIAATFA